MRLIDADVFKTEYENLITWVSHRAEKARLREFIKDIQDQPTVKAIPIEWIKNVWLKNPDNQGEIDFFPPATFEVVMNWLIEDWEKENETNR